MRTTSSSLAIQLTGRARSIGAVKRALMFVAVLIGGAVGVLTWCFLNPDNIESIIRSNANPGSLDIFYFMDMMGFLPVGICMGGMIGSRIFDFDDFEFDKNTLTLLAGPPLFYSGILGIGHGALDDNFNVFMKDCITFATVSLGYLFYFMNRIKAESNID